MGLNPLAVEMMREIGIDISGHRSKSASEFAGRRFDMVVTVCDLARESCPLFPGQPECVHYNLPDPAAVTGSHEERLAAFRRVRDLLSTWVVGFLPERPT